jgi:hypothetical protein
MTPLRSSRGLRGRPARAVGRRRHPQSDKPSLGRCIGFTRTAAGQVSAASARAPVGASPPKRRLARHRRQCRQGGLRIRGRPGAVGGESSCGYSRHATHRGSHRRGICPVVCHPGHASSLVARSRLTCCTGRWTSDSGSRRRQRVDSGGVWWSRHGRDDGEWPDGRHQRRLTRATDRHPRYGQGR